MNIEDILAAEGKKLVEKANIVPPVIVVIPKKLANGVSKYKVGETIMTKGSNSRFVYNGIEGEEYVFEFIPIK